MDNEAKTRNIDIASFRSMQEKLIATNDNAYRNSYGTMSSQFWDRRWNYIEYTPEEIMRIIESGSLEEQRKLSRNYSYKNGYYRQIIDHYATILEYYGILIPNPLNGKKLSTSKISKRYYDAMDYVELINVPTFFTSCARQMLIEGAYFGMIVSKNKNNFVVIDLPVDYCRTRFKDELGNDIIEFNITYFDTITDEKAKKMALDVYPDIVVSAYKAWIRGKRINPWVIIPGDIGVCFPMFDGRPLFLSVIPATIEYDKAKEDKRNKDAEEVKKIIVQKIPHLQDGSFLLEPDEVEELHAGAVGMLRGNPNLSVLTTYADVEAIVSKTGNDNDASILDRFEQDIYVQGAVSKQLFAATGSSALEDSQKTGLGLMMYAARKMSRFVTNLLNKYFANGNINFKYSILPIAYFNEDKYIDNSFKLAASGYSYLLPAIAMGLSQRDLDNVKELENDVLDLQNKLVSLGANLSFKEVNITEEHDGPGRPSLDQKDKSEKTIANEESIDNQTGGN